MSKTSSSHWQLQLVAEKRHTIRQRLDSLAERKHRRMPTKLAVIKKNGMFGNVRRLQPSRHLASVQRIASPVGIAGDDHCGRIGHAIPNLMIRRVFCENGEVVRVVDSAKL